MKTTATATTTTHLSWAVKFIRIASCGWSRSAPELLHSSSSASLLRLRRRFRFSRFLELTSAKCSASNLAASQCRINGLMLITGTARKEGREMSKIPHSVQLLLQGYFGTQINTIIYDTWSVAVIVVQWVKWQWLSANIAVNWTTTTPGEQRTNLSQRFYLIRNVMQWIEPLQNVSLSANHRLRSSCKTVARRVTQ